MKENPLENVIFPNSNRFKSMKKKERHPTTIYMNMIFTQAWNVFIKLDSNWNRSHLICRHYHYSFGMHVK